MINGPVITSYAQSTHQNDVQRNFLEEKLGLAFQRVEGASTRLSNTEGSLLNNSQAQNRENYPMYESKDVPVIGAL